jgi:ribosomal protein L37E
MEIQNFASKELTMEEFIELILENGLDYNVEWNDEQYLVTLNNVHKVVRVTGGSSSGSEFICIELIPKEPVKLICKSCGENLFTIIPTEESELYGICNHCGFGKNLINYIGK